MDFTNQELNSYDQEVDSPLPPHELLQPSSEPPPPLQSIGRQSSVYARTLYELQSTMCEDGKTFGLMNMDEFLSNVWSAEEQEAQAQADANNNIMTATNQFDDHKRIDTQNSLPRSISIPVPLSQKTVDEVWAEIHKGQQDQQHKDTTSNIIVNHNDDNPEADSTQQRQLTMGEMTLEDFLVRAGVVKEAAPPAPLTVPVYPYQKTYGSPYPNTSPTLMGTGNFVPTMPVMNTVGINVPEYQSMMQPRPMVGGEIPITRRGAMKRGGRGYTHHHQSTTEVEVEVEVPPSIYGGRRRTGNGNGNEGGGYAQVTPLAAVAASPVSPVSSDVLVSNQGDGTSYDDVLVPNQGNGTSYDDVLVSSQGDGTSYDGVDMSGYKGSRKRAMDGSVEKGVERRQRRMLKNRESAARSRARKQTYTIELQAEVNQLREENAHLKQKIADKERKKSQHTKKIREEMRMRAKTKKDKKECGRLRMLRRTASYP